MMAYEDRTLQILIDTVSLFKKTDTTTGVKCCFLLLVLMFTRMLPEKMSFRVIQLVQSILSNIRAEVKKNER